MNPTSCKAIIRHNDMFILFLRDDKDSIPFPGYWDFFGGGIEDGEDLLECIKREIKEELSIDTEPKYLETIPEDTNPVRYVAVFEATLNDEQFSSMKFTGEGQRWDEFTSQQLKDMKTIPHFNKYF